MVQIDLQKHDLGTPTNWIVLEAITLGAFAIPLDSQHLWHPGSIAVTEHSASHTPPMGRSYKPVRL